MIIIINGQAGAGKDTFVKMCMNYVLDKGLPCLIDDWSMVDVAKSLIHEGLPWISCYDEDNFQIKSPEYRTLLYEIKQALDKYDDISFKQILDNYKTLEENFYFICQRIYFIHARESKDIKRLIEYFTSIGEQVKTLYLTNPHIPHIVSNEADRQAVEDNEIEYDYIIVNDGSKEELEEKVEEFITMINKEIQKWNTKN